MHSLLFSCFSSSSSSFSSLSSTPIHPCHNSEAIFSAPFLLFSTQTRKFSRGKYPIRERQSCVQENVDRYLKKEVETHIKKIIARATSVYKMKTFRDVTQMYTTVHSGRTVCLLPSLLDMGEKEKELNAQMTRTNKAVVKERDSISFFFLPPSFPPSLPPQTPTHTSFLHHVRNNCLSIFFFAVCCCCGRNLRRRRNAFSLSSSLLPLPSCQKK